ncbi:aggregation-promoting factor C-terminal-like domain-containing protein [Microlunatus flavus]|uniref:aggregation-promoting factor C-terminal-like domain-containing protein n=1 Tax=Microlunatus flavus TaxID=1036181 RepID=UPI000B86F713|nr:transglycosylase SLT domain-containing protein [Microlunatus flavus]
MRSVVRHGLVGVVAAVCVGAGAAAFVTPSPTSTVADPPAASVAPGEFVPVAYAPADPVADAERAATAARDDRDAERARVAAVAAGSAYQRALSLSAQGEAIDRQSTQKKAEIKAQVQAAKERAEAAEAEAAAAEERARQAAIANQGYTPGTTDVREIARQILANKFSYGEDQFSCFDWIIKRESGWNVHATNPSSGAYGLPQSLPGSKMASVAADWRDNPATQIIWGVSYMKSRYGSPCDAKSHWESAGNY